MAKILVVFDCDETLVEGTVEFQAVTVASDDLVDRLATMMNEKDCPETMDSVMGEIHRAGHGKEEILESVSSMYVFPEMVAVIEKIRDRRDVDIMLLSGANDVLVKCILSKIGIWSAFKRVITNYAHFDEHERLRISAYHVHDCETCTGICKGTILREILSSYQRVIYVGDGDNDVCPAMALSVDDHVIAREFFPLATRLSDYSKSGCSINASVHTVDFKSDEVESLLLSLLPLNVSSLESSDTRLVVFDFDHTLVDGNTDTHVFGIAPELGLKNCLSALRQRIPCWPLMIDHVMGEIHSSGHSKEEIIGHMKKMKFCSGMPEALQVFSTMPKTVIAILSDSNTVFIDILLGNLGLNKSFSHIVTNPAYFSEDGRLHIGCYHSHSCQRCHRTPNLCKGTALKNLLSECRYDQVIYIGDGRNDVCPCTMLSSGDHVIAREGFSLAEGLKELEKNGDPIRASVHTVDFNSDQVKQIVQSVLANN